VETTAVITIRYIPPLARYLPFVRWISEVALLGLFIALLLLSINAPAENFYAYIMRYINQ